MIFFKGVANNILRWYLNMQASEGSNGRRDLSLSFLPNPSAIATESALNYLFKSVAYEFWVFRNKWRS